MKISCLMNRNATSSRTTPLKMMVAAHCLLTKSHFRTFFSSLSGASERVPVSFGSFVIMVASLSAYHFFCDGYGLHGVLGVIVGADLFRIVGGQHSAAHDDFAVRQDAFTSWMVSSIAPRVVVISAESPTSLTPCSFAVSATSWHGTSRPRSSTV